MTAMNYWLSLLPLLLSAVLLAVVLIARESQNSRIQQQLLNKLLVKEGLEPLPVTNPFEELIGNEAQPEVSEKFAEAIKAIARRKPKATPVRFTIPGMPSGMGDVTARGK